jgi:subtilisin family serine protease
MLFKTLTVIQAINWAVREQKVDVVSMSLGWDKEVMVNGKPVVSNAISETLGSRDQKVLFFAAASNFGGGKRVMFPATHKDVFSIRATNARGSHQDFNASLSKYDPFVLGTLGYRVPTAQRGGTETQIGRTGTSVATAVTAGIVALILGYINMSPARMSWESVKTYDKMLSVLEALSEEPEKMKRFITPDKFPLSSDSVKEFEAILTMAST